MYSKLNSLNLTVSPHSKAFYQVGPFANPSEQYEYYTLPFCAPKVVQLWDTVDWFRNGV